MVIKIILIIAEKPSLARNIAGAIGSFSRKNGYLENNDYIITWAFGHLFSLCDIDFYSPNPDGTTKWCRENIPCFPEKFCFELKKGVDKQVDPGVVKQFETIKALCNREDVTTIVNAGDSDREGEIIIRLCIENSSVKDKDLRRLWLPDQTNETILASLAEMKEEREYDNLANEGFARTYTDWLYGVNLTRYATLKTGTLLRVGRVIVPIVKAIYDRDMSIRNFTPDIYYALVSEAETKGEKIELTSKQKFDKNDYGKALEVCKQYNELKAVVENIKKKKTTLAPGKLYSLTKLQNFLGKKYKMSMDASLKIVQDLYEKGYLTYPRTNSEYLATAEKDKIKKILSNVKAIGYDVEFKDNKTIFDDSKIESHSALTPTYKIPKKQDLSETEFIVYSTVMKRFTAVFCREDCIVEKTEIKINLGDVEEFSLKGNVVVEKGWTKYDTYTKKDKTLPLLNKGDIINVGFKPVEKETNPPKHYTIETLNNYLKNPFKDDKANESTDDTDEYKAIFEGLELGTEATRTGIIDNARKSNYILLNKDVYTILPDGEFLIESLTRMNIIMDKYKTSQLGRALKQVFRGEITVDNSIDIAKKEIKNIFDYKDDENDIGFYGDVVGVCPACKNEVVRTKFGYGCKGYKDGCKFSISFVICNHVISSENVKLLLETGKTKKITGFVSKKTGKSFDSFLKLENNRVVFDFGN